MSLNELRDKAYKIADEHGFHGIDEHGINQDDLCRKLMLTVGELSEAMEADRKGKWCGNPKVDIGFEENNICQLSQIEPNSITDAFYEAEIKGTVEEEIADAIIRLLDFAGIHNIDLDWHVQAKMAYNEKREYKHGKKY